MERRQEASFRAEINSTSETLSKLGMGSKMHHQLNGEQDAIVAQLNDMFADVVSTDKIFEICKLFDWQLEECIEALIRPEIYAEDGSNGAVSYPEIQLDIPQEPWEVNDNKEKSFEETREAEIEAFSKDRENRNLGAIPKWIPRVNEQIAEAEKTLSHQRAFSELIKNAVAEHDNKSLQSSKQSKSPSSRTKQIDPLLRKIRQGYKVMILMRGAPGSGKSYLARQIVDETVKGSAYRDHICSTDDYFYDRNGNYVYRPDELAIAHDMNRRQAKAQAMNGWSPLIIDNTHMKQWEMFEYVKIAVENGYLLEIVEPKTHWSKSAGKCAVKNRHGVPKDKIQRMMYNYEPTTVQILMEICNCKYTVPIPQLRSRPPLKLAKKETITSLSSTPPIDIPASNQQSDDDVFLTAKEEAAKLTASFEYQDQNQNTQDGAQSSDNADNWKSYEQESEEYWKEQQQQSKQSSKGNLNNLPKPPRRPEQHKEPKVIESNRTSVETSTQKECEDLISFDIEPINPEPNQTKGTANSVLTDKLERHVMDCDNENKSFVTLRQIYPNKEVDGLWDLFEKCQGDIDWAVDILLKDDSCVEQQRNAMSGESFQCNCNQDAIKIETEIFESYETLEICEEIKESISPKKQRPKRNDKLSKASEQLEELKKSIENQFVLGEQHYSERIKKVRDFRHKPANNSSEPPVLTNENQLVDYEEAEQTAAESKENDDMSSEPEDDETVEMILGEELVEQLASIFDSELIPKNMIKDLKTNVSIPKSLAYQLYLVWVESVYNQAEEERDRILKDDEEFAKVLSQKETYQQCTDLKSLSNELTSHFYNTERNCWEANTEDLASHLTKLKLSEEFPDVGQQTLLETLGSTDNRYEETVEILQSSLGQRAKAARGEEGDASQEGGSQDFDPERNDLDSAFGIDKNLNPDEAKKIALHNFEVNRNMAVHHSQLKAECYRKAKEAIQKGNTAVAVYYSQIADLHKQKVDTFNHTAANYIVAVHDVTQNNPDFIDLHYLHVFEAEQCLDIFVDKHIRKLKSVNKSYKYIFIITGRGLHSAGGVSIIKNKVKSRLKDRNLKWSELNPGLLKVKVFATSKFGNKVNI